MNGSNTAIAPKYIPKADISKMDYSDRRTALSFELGIAEDTLGINSKVIKLIPYAMVIGINGDQKILPVGTDKEFYTQRMENNGSDGKLVEYQLALSGVISNGGLRGVIFPRDIGYNGNSAQLHIFGNEYGGYEGKKVILNLDGFNKGKGWRREGLEVRLKKLIMENMPSIITLKETDDITGILKDQFQYKFNDNIWFPR